MKILLTYTAVLYTAVAVALIISDEAAFGLSVGAMIGYLGGIAIARLA